MSYCYPIDTNKLDNIIFFISPFMEFKEKEEIEEKIKTTAKLNGCSFIKNLERTLLEYYVIKYIDINDLAKKIINKLFKYLDIKNYVDILRNLSPEEIAKILPDKNNLIEYNRELRKNSKLNLYSNVDYRILKYLSLGLIRILDKSYGYNISEKDLKTLENMLENIFNDKKILQRLEKISDLLEKRYGKDIAKEFISPIIDMILDYNNYNKAKDFMNVNINDYILYYINLLEILGEAFKERIPSLYNFLSFIRYLSYYLPEEYLEISGKIIYKYEKNILNIDILEKIGEYFYSLLERSRGNIVDDLITLSKIAKNELDGSSF
ncbi:MAG: hypothetical protein ACP5GJ_02060 [Nanopusillaceae archaeon]